MEDDGLVVWVERGSTSGIRANKKTVSGLSVKEAKEVLYKAINEIESETIVCRSF